MESESQKAESAFRESIHENPVDHTTRLVYSDWLDEQGYHANAEDHRLIGRLLNKWHDEDAPLNKHIPDNRNNSFGYHWVQTHASGRNPFPNLAIRHQTIENAEENGFDVPEQNQPQAIYETDQREPVKSFSDGSAIKINKKGENKVSSIKDLNLNIDSQEHAGMIDEDTADLARTLVINGPVFSGGTHRHAIDLAREWNGYFQGEDGPRPSEWIDSGYWNPQTAHEAMYRGYQPGENPGTTDDVDDPIYSLCNGDTDFVDAD